MVKRKAPAPPARENIAPVGADAGTVGECAPLHSPILGPADSAAPPLSELGSRLDALSNAFSRLGDREREAASGAAVALANENSALREQVQAQDALVSTLRAELARVNARLSAEGGDARVPPAVIRSSSLFAEAISRAKAADALAVAADARAAAADARTAAAVTAAAAVPAGAAATVAVLSALTDISVCARAGASAVSGVPAAGVFDCVVVAPGGKRVEFELDFFTDDDGVPSIEFVPGAGAAEHLSRAAFLQQTIAFTADMAPMFFAKVTEALRGADADTSATTTIASRTPRTASRDISRCTPRGVLSARTPGVTPGNAPDASEDA